MRIQIWLILLVLFSGCGQADEERVEEKKNERITNISILQIQPDSLVQYSHLPAAVKAFREVTISALESGVVARIFKDLGNEVEKEEVLAEQVSPLLQSSAIEAEGELTFQNYNLERARELHAEGSISEQDFLEAQYHQQRTKSKALSIRTRLGYLQIKAPFKGEVAARSIEIGQLIGPGGPAFHLVQTHRVKVEAWVPENEIADFAEGAAVEIKFDAHPSQVFRGTVTRLGPASRAGRRVYPLEVDMPNEDGTILPGMMGKLKAVRRAHRNVVVIPRQAVLEREEGPAAFITRDSLATMRSITLGPSSGDRVVVTRGLVFGDHLIVKGARDLIEGDRVQVMEIFGK